MPNYEWKSKQRPETIVTVFRPLTAIELPPNEAEVREALAEDQDALAEVLQGEWERCVSLTLWAQAPGYRQGGKGSKGGFNPKRSS